jgi:hypothetical protein
MFKLRIITKHGLVTIIQFQLKGKFHAWLETTIQYTAKIIQHKAYQVFLDMSSN